MKDRIGLLDRKLRVVNENTQNEAEWITWAVRAFQSVYGFEYQGDNLLLARENLLYTFIDYLQARLNREPSFNELKTVATIISWNLWQMDGMKFTVPYGSISEQYQQLTLEDLTEKSHPEPCYCKIRDWRSKETVTYYSLVHRLEGDAL